MLGGDAAPGSGGQRRGAHPRAAAADPAAAAQAPGGDAQPRGVREVHGALQGHGDGEDLPCDSRGSRRGENGHASRALPPCLCRAHAFVDAVEQSPESSARCGIHCD